VKRLCIVVLFIACLCSSVFSRKNIIEFYKEIPKQLIGGYKFPVEMVMGKWQSKDEDYGTRRAVFDIKNGYMYIEDFGTGGGHSAHELALFRLSDGSALIAFNNLSVDDPNGSFSEISFFRKISSKWNNVTKDVFPEVQLKLFVNEQYKSKVNNLGEIADHIHFIYSLPQHGTTVTAMLSTERLAMAESFSNVSPAKKQLVKDILANVSHEEVKLAWNKVRCKFTIDLKAGEEQTISDPAMVKIVVSVVPELLTLYFTAQFTYMERNGHYCNKVEEMLNLTKPEYQWFELTYEKQQNGGTLFKATLRKPLNELKKGTYWYYRTDGKRGASQALCKKYLPSWE